MRNRVAALSTVLLVAVLAALSVAVVTVLGDLGRGTAAVQQAVSGLTAYQDVQRALAAEAFAESGYRRSPGEMSRVRLETAVAGVSASIEKVQGLGNLRDDGVVSYLLVLNRRYEAEIRSQLRTGALAPGVSADDRVAGPALDAMQALVDAAVDLRTQRATWAIAEQRSLTQQLKVLGPVGLVIALTCVGLCWWVILAQHRNLRVEALASAQEARHDPLTGIGNRAKLAASLATELARSAPDAVLLMIDLDRFKQVNDEHGHAAGDAVLVAVASRLSGAAGFDDVVCRMGGDEFAVLVRPAGDAPLRQLEVQRVLAQPVSFGTVLLTTGGSVGSVPLRAGMDQSQLLREVDEALYAAKRAGRVPPQRSVRSGVS